MKRFLMKQTKIRIDSQMKHKDGKDDVKWQKRQKQMQ